ncbi:MAG: hypothetical protein KDB00_05850 [Planctomycetales bacterium]|nr:hypothetical protein [Planctomycetales bacterium]
MLQAAIDQVATLGASDQRFRELVLFEFEKQCDPDGDRVIRRNLLHVLTKWLAQAGESAWQAEFADGQGIDGSVFHGAHVEAKTGSLRESCDLALRDLFFN